MLEGNSPQRRRIQKASDYIKRGDWADLWQEVMQFLAWKGIVRSSRQMRACASFTPRQSLILWGSAQPSLEHHSTLWTNKSFDNFLSFETQVFGESFPIPAYDPYLIRYGEYRFVLEMLPFQSGETVLDLGCERNIFILYLAHLGVRALGVDLNPQVWEGLHENKTIVERMTGRKLDVTFRAEDATRLGLESESVDKVIAISSIEHMFSEQGHGDQLAMAGVARVLKPGGLAVITLPMSNGGPFHEAPKGDEQFGGPYRLYTPEALKERILSQPELDQVQLCHLAHTTPDSRYAHLQFFRFWMESLTPEERRKWAWANPILAAIFNPIVSQEEGERRPETVNTVLICLRKKS